MRTGALVSVETLGTLVVSILLFVAFVAIERRVRSPLIDLALFLGWALANVATQAVVPSSLAGAASGITLTSLVMLGAVAVAIAAAVLDLLSGSASTAAADTDALDVVIRAAGVLAFVGASGLLVLGRSKSPVPAAKTAG